MNPYKLGSDKCLIHVKNECIEGWEHCEDLKRLTAFIEKPIGSVKEGVNWIGAKIPADIMKKVFATVHKFPHMETGFVMYYDSHNRKWFVKCPEQRGWGGHVSMNDDGTGIPPGGFSAIGTIHTHPGMNAFWSSGDLADQKGPYGLHMVFGLREGIAKEIKATIFTPESHYDIPVDTILEAVDVDKTPEFEAPQEWVDTITKGINGGINHAMSFQRQDFQPSAGYVIERVYGSTTYPSIGSANWMGYQYTPNRTISTVRRPSEEEAQKLLAAWRERYRQEDAQLEKEEQEWNELQKRGEALLASFQRKMKKNLGVTDRVLLAWACLQDLNIRDVELDETVFQLTREFLDEVSNSAVERQNEMDEFQEELSDMIAEDEEADEALKSLRRMQ